MIIILLYICPIFVLFYFIYFLILTGNIKKEKSCLLEERYKKEK